MYGKIFESIFDSTLVAEGGWLPTYIFMSMIAMADKDGYVEIAPRALYSKLGFREHDSIVTYNQFEAAITYLGKVDDYSKSTDFDGRRIIPISELPDVEGARGWWIVNYDKYRNRASREDRATQSTERSRRWRERQKKPNKNNNGTQGDALGRRGRYTDTDTDTKKREGRFTPPTPDEVQKYLDENGITEFTGKRFCDYYESVNWMRGKSKIKSWKHCVGTWRKDGAKSKPFGANAV